ncbi:hydrogenase maturation protease [Sedimenticola hydrogenitrophicus]|uniref:hydrogenase maturation protease n=1 Tax=Sedimenticola hydrogenitrophicus TaxID=2967975 RepID=UPI0021A8BB75
MSGAPIAVIGYGNPSRGDDALGPELLERLAAATGIDPGCYEPITDFQLQIEHVTDLQRRELLLFVDASVTARPPFEFSRLTPHRDHSYSSHSLSPATLLSVYQEVYKTAPPPAFLLAIPGYRFELGEPLCQRTAAHLARAVDFVRDLLAQPNGTFWNAQVDLMARPFEV